MEGVRIVPELRGIIPNSFAHIFGHIAKMDGDIRYLAWAFIIMVIIHFISQFIIVRVITENND